MKKYIAAIESLTDKVTFKIVYDTNTGLLETADGEEIYDMGTTHVTDKKLIETVYALYNTNSWEITDCIKYEDAPETKKFEVIENNAGNLYLVTFDADGDADYIAGGYEENPGQLAEDLEQLKQGADPVADGWEFGGLEDALDERTPDELYRELTETGSIVADNGGTYPERMGQAASQELR